MLSISPLGALASASFFFNAFQSTYYLPVLICIVIKVIVVILNYFVVIQLLLFRVFPLLCFYPFIKKMSLFVQFPLAFLSSFLLFQVVS